MNNTGSLRSAVVASAALMSLSLGGMFLATSPSVAQSRSLEGQTVVLYTFGGTQLELTKELVIAPFEKETGAKVVIDDSCCSRIEAAIAAGQFLGDVVVGLDRGGMLNRDSLGQFVHDPRLEKIARDAGTKDPYPSQSMLILHSYSSVIAGSPEVEQMPANWAEFWDVKEFPGTRGVNKITPAVALEAALLADGVKSEDLYPLDVDRAFRKMDELRDTGQLVFFTSGADQINKLGTSEVDYGITNRAFLAKQDGIEIKFDYADGFVTGNGGAILKGARNIDGAVAFLEYHYRPEVLALFAERTGMAPAFEASTKQIGSDLMSMMPTAPGNIEKQHQLNDEFWKEHRKEIFDRWVTWQAN